MSYLYSIYLHPQKGSWGFTDVIEGAVHTAAIAPDGAVTRAKVEPLKLGPELQRRIRGGYARVAQAKYLHEINTEGGARGEFVTQHPDLGADLQGDCLLFVAIVPSIDMRGAVEEWTRRMDVLADSHARDRWLEHCAAVTAYVPAMSIDPGSVLVVAQWAHDHNLVLVANAGTAPRGAPSAERHNWRAYLSEWFALPQIDQALADLGWPLSEGLNLPKAAETTQTTAGAPTWMESAQQISF